MDLEQTKNSAQSVAEVPTPKGRWHLQIRLNGGYASVYDDPSEKTFPTEESAWACARRCYPDTEHLSVMVRVVFVPE